LNPWLSLEGGNCVAEAWRLGRLARVAADALPQAGQFGRQGGELLSHLFILLTQHQELLPLRPYLLTDTTGAQIDSDAAARNISFRLTESGAALQPVFEGLGRWSHRHLKALHAGILKMP
jgi:hypothetical protein